jgi:hypothetical protein
VLGELVVDDLAKEHCSREIGKKGERAGDVAHTVPS